MSDDAMVELDSILSAPPPKPKSEGECKPQSSVLVDILRKDDVISTVEAPIPTEIFSTFLVSPSYFVDIDEMLLIKLSSAKGEPFFILDKSKVSKSLVCGITEIFLTPYAPETACVDECDGMMPSLHLVPECVCQSLLSNSLQKVSTARWFLGLVFISSVGVQFYYRDPQQAAASLAVGEDVNIDKCQFISSVYRVATDSAGNIEARDVPGAVTCDYPVPYFLVDYTVFSEATHTCEIIESLVQANISVIDFLCHQEYETLHEAQKLPDILAETIEWFMGRHSHTIRGLLQNQSGIVGCDPYQRRQRKSEIDIMTRLMMREVELIGNLKKTMEELLYVQESVENKATETLNLHLRSNSEEDSPQQSAPLVVAAVCGGDRLQETTPNESMRDYNTIITSPLTSDDC